MTTTQRNGETRLTVACGPSATDRDILSEVLMSTLLLLTNVGLKETTRVTSDALREDRSALPLETTEKLFLLLTINVLVLLALSVELWQSALPSRIQFVLWKLQKLLPTVKTVLRSVVTSEAIVPTPSLQALRVKVAPRKEVLEIRTLIVQQAAPPSCFALTVTRTPLLLQEDLAMTVLATARLSMDLDILVLALLPSASAAALAVDIVDRDPGTIKVLNTMNVAVVSNRSEQTRV